MGLSNELASQFIKLTKPTKSEKKESTVHGTTVEFNGTVYVKLDGSDRLTPITTTTVVKPGERVNVLIKDHTATITGNVTSPSARVEDVDNVANQVTEFEIVMAYKVTTTDLEAVNATIEQLKVKVGKFNELSAVYAKIETLQAKYAELDYVSAGEAKILDAEIENLKAEIGTFEEISTEDLEAINADIGTLKAYTADFTYVSADRLTALKAEIKELDTTKISAEQAEIKFANIDFSNIGEAAITKLFSESGIIKDLIVKDGAITGELVGVTIKGDVIEGGTVKADKLVVKGTDGLFYKLNIDAMGETTTEHVPTDSLHGSVIAAKSITADRIAVTDLVAFGATIGGFRIDNHSLYSGVKSSATNTTRGVFLGDSGEFAVGDSSNYLRYYYETESNTYKLEISAATIRMGGSNNTVEEELKDIRDSNDKTLTNVDVEYYLSNSATQLVGGTWQTTAPEWVDGKYMWSRTVTTYQNGVTKSSDPTCIAGATGATGVQGSQGEKGDQGIPGTNGTNGQTSYLHIAYANNSTGTSGFSVSDSTNKTYIGQYTDFTSSDSTDPTKYSWTKIKGEIGPQGPTGVGISSVTEYYQVSTSNTTAPTSWSTSVPTLTSTNKYLWNYEAIKMTDNSTKETAKRVIGVYGDKGATGSTGSKGDTGETGKGIKSITNYYLATASASGVTTSTSGWTTSVQSVTSSKKYLWNYEVVTYTDNSTTVTAPCIIGAYGDRGLTGATGATGKGIKSVTNYYLATSISSGVTLSTAGWSTTVQSVTLSKKYLWNYEVITYTDNSTASTEPCVIGAYGSTGATGNGISSITEYYQVSTSNTTAPTSWKTTVPAMTSTSKYLWNYEQITYTNGASAETAKRVIGVYGDTGSTGSAGTGVVSITEQYYVSTSKTSQTGGSWSSTTPTWSPGKYIWTRSVIVYKNPSSTVYTDPVCDSSWEAVNEIEVGGRNLLRDSKNLLDIHSNNNATTAYPISVETIDEDGRKFVRVRRTNTSVNPTTLSLYNSILPDSFTDNIIGKEITVSYLARTNYNVTARPMAYIMYVNTAGSSVTVNFDNATIYESYGSTWTRYSRSIVVPSDISKITVLRFSPYMFSGITAENVDKFYIDICEWKMEFGNKATDWTPAPEDMENDISDAKDSASNAITIANNAYTEIDSLKGQIVTLTTDSSGESILTQNGSGWSFDLKALENTIANVSDQIVSTDSNVKTIDSAVQKLDSLLKDVDSRTAYIDMYKTSDGKPVIELGKRAVAGEEDNEESNFKVRITNEAIDFMEGEEIVAYVNGLSLFITKAVVKQEIQIGDVNTGRKSSFVWKVRSNGNMGIVWRGPQSTE